MGFRPAIHSDLGEHLSLSSIDIPEPDPLALDFGLKPVINDRVMTIPDLWIIRLCCVYEVLTSFYSLVAFNLRALETTEIEEKAIAAAAMTGLRRKPKNG
jgi:hypothetical protein